MVISHSYVSLPEGRQYRGPISRIPRDPAPSPVVSRVTEASRHGASCAAEEV
jgi:hypothetical protein